MKQGHAEDRLALVLIVCVCSCVRACVRVHVCAILYFISAN